MIFSFLLLFCCCCCTVEAQTDSSSTALQSFLIQFLGMFATPETAMIHHNYTTVGSCRAFVSNCACDAYKIPKNRQYIVLNNYDPVRANELISRLYPTMLDYCEVNITSPQAQKCLGVLENFMCTLIYPPCVSSSDGDGRPFCSGACEQIKEACTGQLGVKCSVFTAAPCEGVFYRKTDCRDLYPLLPDVPSQQERHAKCHVDCNATDMCPPRVIRTSTFGDNCRTTYASDMVTASVLIDPARPNVVLPEVRVQAALASSPIDFLFLGLDELDEFRYNNEIDKYSGLLSFNDVASLTWDAFCEKWRDNDTVVSFRTKLPNGAIVTMSALVITSGDQLIETAPGHSYVFNNGTYKFTIHVANWPFSPRATYLRIRTGLRYNDTGKADEFLPTQDPIVRYCSAEDNCPVQDQVIKCDPEAKCEAGLITLVTQGFTMNVRSSNYIIIDGQASRWVDDIKFDAQTALQCCHLYPLNFDVPRFKSYVYFDPDFRFAINQQSGYDDDVVMKVDPPRALSSASNAGTVAVIVILVIAIVVLGAVGALFYRRRRHLTEQAGMQ